MEQISFIPLANLMLGFIPVIILIGIMYFWGLKISNSIYANFRMLIQLLLIGYVLTFIFETDEPISIAEVLNRLDIASSTVLAVLGETIVPHSSTITEDIEIELIVVSSGG